MKGKKAYHQPERWWGAANERRAGSNLHRGVTKGIHTVSLRSFGLTSKLTFPPMNEAITQDQAKTQSEAVYNMLPH